MDYEDLEKFFSKERMKKYLVMANNDKEKAVKLYFDNINYSSKLYTILSYFEVFLRNKINNKMAKIDKEWLINLTLLNAKILNKLKIDKNLSVKTYLIFEKFFKVQENLLDIAEHDLLEDKKPITNDYLVSRLNFGFWTRLLNKVYEDDIWRKYLVKTFGKKIKRGAIEKDLNELRRLRNRIAHNECVLNLKHTPVEYYDFMIDFIKKIDVKTAVWIENQMSRALFTL